MSLFGVVLLLIYSAEKIRIFTWV